MLEIPNLNKIYEDDLCTVFLHDVKGDGSLLVMHADVVKTTDRRILEHYLEVADTIFDELRKRGIPKVEAWMCTDEQIRFAQFLGFGTMVGQLTVNGRETLPEVYRLEKEL
jgi:hypothetical protein